MKKLFKKKRVQRMIALAAVVIIAAFSFYYFKQRSPSEPKLAPITVGALTESYTNDKYNFTFNYPSGFKPSFAESTVDGKDILTVNNTTGISTAGFQIDISAIDEDIKALTVDRIRQDLPDIKIENSQDVILGASGKGVAFMSDDPAFGGNSREVWFVYKKHLYQIRTYAVYDNLLKAVLDTWKFQK